jgi:hypothetical protein
MDIKAQWLLRYFVHMGFFKKWEPNQHMLWLDQKKKNINYKYLFLLETLIWLMITAMEDVDVNICEFGN